tara:strand:+ start:85 stop:276 length:192 start_codon:yes stop_codon:yes gene_type:complete
MDKNNDLLNKIDIIISDTENYEKAIKVNNGDILIRNKNKKKKDSLLTNVFKEMIRNDIKKKRV